MLVTDKAIIINATDARTEAESQAALCALFLEQNDLKSATIRYGRAAVFANLYYHITGNRLAQDSAAFAANIDKWDCYIPREARR